MGWEGELVCWKNSLRGFVSRPHMWMVVSASPTPHRACVARALGWHVVLARGCGKASMLALREMEGVIAEPFA